MRMRWVVGLFVGFLLGSLGICDEKESSRNRANWSKKMQELSEVIPNLLPDIAFYSRFSNEKNFKRIEENTKKLAELAHKINMKDKATSVQIGDADPTIEMMAGQLEKRVQQAYEALKAGNRDYARQQLMAVTQYCIGCHSRSDSGPEFESLPMNKALGPLTDLDRADLFAATRQFDKALELYGKVASETMPSRDRAVDWEKSILRALAISVRVKKDPDQALKIVDRLLNAEAVPAYLKEDARLWKKSLLAWKKEPKSRQLTSQGYLSEANRLIASANLIKKYPADAAGDMYYLRATSVLHDLLKEKRSAQQTSEALYLLGVSYEALSTLIPGALSDVYLESCIHNLPHSAIAWRCYLRYDEAVHLGYSGTANYDLPENVVRHLAGLAEEAKPKGEKKKK